MCLDDRAWGGADKIVRSSAVCFLGLETGKLQSKYSTGGWRKSKLLFFSHPGLERSSFLGGSDGSDDPDDGKDVINPSFSIRGLPTVAMLQCWGG